MDLATENRRGVTAHPRDRARTGSKHHLITEAHGVAL
jgi:hypothetical protein